MLLGAKIKAARLAAKLTQTELAEQIKVKNTTISNWENNVSKPDPDTIENLCWALNMSPNYFFNHIETSPRTTEIPTAKNIMPLPKTYKVPLLGKIACGCPILAVEDAEEVVDVSDYIRADFALRCSGDSMINARIFDGDIVYIHSQPVVENGEIAAVRIEDEATLKRVRLFEDHISLEPENPMYKPLVIWGEDMNTVEILGKAVGFSSVII